MVSDTLYLMPGCTSMTVLILVLMEDGLGLANETIGSGAPES